jgi:hypothetical protein
MAARTPTTLGVVASLIAIGGLGFAVWKALSADGRKTSATVEAKQIGSFHQLVNQICTENRQALKRAVPEARSGMQLLTFLSRATRRGVNDLEGVTAPASLAAHFAAELDVRRQIQEALLKVQSAEETGDGWELIDADRAIGSAEKASFEIDRELGVEECAPVLPSSSKGAVNGRVFHVG